MGKAQTYGNGGALRPRLKEAGGSVVILVASLPLLLLLVCAVVDLGRYVYLHMSLQEAAFAASADLTQSSYAQEGDAQAQALESAMRAAPGLSNERASLSCSVSCGLWENRAFDSYRYRDSLKAFETVETTLLQREVTVSLKLSSDCLTVVGRAFLSSTGSVHDFELEACATAIQSKLGNGG